MALEGGVRRESGWPKVTLSGILWVGGCGGGGFSSPLAVSRAPSPFQGGPEESCLECREKSSCQGSVLAPPIRRGLPVISGYLWRQIAGVRGRLAGAACVRKKECGADWLVPWAGLLPFPLPGGPWGMCGT